MPKIGRTIVGALFAITGLAAGFGSFYTVDQTEQAVVTRFGKAIRVVLNPIESRNNNDELALKYSVEGVDISYNAGLKFKVPFIDGVKKFDRRLLRWNSLPEEIPTKEKRVIWADGSARFYNEDPLKFFNAVTFESGAHAKLDEVVDSETRNAITTRNLIDSVRTDNRQMRIAEEELRSTLPLEMVVDGRSRVTYFIAKNSDETCKEKYGIRIPFDGFLIRGINYNEASKVKVEDRMIAERTRVAGKYLSEGESAYQRILGERDNQVKSISSGGNRLAKEIIGSADAEAARIYSDAYSKDPDFYNFVRNLNLIEKGTGSGTKAVFDLNGPFFKIMKGEGSR